MDRYFNKLYKNNWMLIKKKKKIPNTYITTCPKTNSNRAINKFKKL